MRMNFVRTLVAKLFIFLSASGSVLLLSSEPASAETDHTRLILRPGLHGPAYTSEQPALDQPAKDIPKREVVVDLPLFPGAVDVSKTKLPGRSFSYSMSPYLKTASAVYLIPAHSGAAWVWCHKHLLASGYSPNGAGYSGQTNNFDNIQITVDYCKGDRLNDDHTSVKVSIEPSEQGKSLLWYTAEVVERPERDPRTLIKSNVARIDITHNILGPSPQTKTCAISSKTEIDKIVSSFNALIRDNRGVGHHGSTAIVDTYTIVFTSTDKSKNVVNMDLSGIRDGGLSLIDSDGLFGTLISNALGKNSAAKSSDKEASDQATTLPDSSATEAPVAPKRDPHSLLAENVVKITVAAYPRERPLVGAPPLGRSRAKTSDSSHKEAMEQPAKPPLKTVVLSDKKDIDPIVSTFNTLECSVDKVRRRPMMDYFTIAFTNADGSELVAKETEMTLTVNEMPVRLRSNYLFHALILDSLRK